MDKHHIHTDIIPNPHQLLYTCIQTRLLFEQGAPAKILQDFARLLMYVGIYIVVCGGGVY
jgi:hypothetical protein